MKGRTFGISRVTTFACLMFSLVVAACDGSSPQTSAPPPPASPPPGAPPPVAAPAPEEQPVDEVVELKDGDFKESESNRDPFRPYLSEFLTPQRRAAKIQRKVLLQSYGLDELQLIAVVTGRVRPLAMFRDPAGLGVAVKRGDYISKSAAKVKQIEGHKVIVQMEEQAEGRQLVADRVIELHPRSEGR